MSVRLRFHPYRLPLRQPWHSARQRVDERRGWLVTASAGGEIGYGDCAPLPQAGTEPARDALHRLSHWCEHAGGRSPQDLLDALASQLPTSMPAADGAVETALLDLAARRAGVPLRRLLAGLPLPSQPTAPPPPAAASDRIGVNAMLGAAATVTAAALDQAVGAGFRVIKLKVGTADWPTERLCIDRILSRLPAGVTLRLDANGAWQADVARAAVADLAALDGTGRIESLEEPLCRPDDRQLTALQRAAPFALALDESLALRAPVEPRRLPARRLVLKPGVFGGLRATRDLATRALAAGREVVLTSLVESAAGLWATAQLAGAIGSPLAHGIGTAHWLAVDLGEAPAVVDGGIRLPEVAGSGFVPVTGLS